MFFFACYLSYTYEEDKGDEVRKENTYVNVLLFPMKLVYTRKNKPNVWKSNSNANE